jgi:hypothetical protein
MDQIKLRWSHAAYANVGEMKFKYSAISVMVGVCGLMNRETRGKK